MGHLKNHCAGGLACLAFWATVTGAQAQGGPDDPSVITLAPIVVSATGFAQTLPDAPATVTVIDAEEIAGKPYATVTDVLKDVPGVIVGAPSGRSGAESISIRGLGEDYVLTLVDGRPIGNSREATYNGFGSGLSFSYLPPPSAIERIEVIRGPMSSLYGSAASGGVINIITKPVSDEWTGTLTAGTTNYADGGAGSADETRFYLSGPILLDRLGLALYGARHERDKEEVEVASRRGTSIQSQKITRESLGGRLTWAMTERQQLKFDILRSTTDTVSTPEGGSPGGISSERRNYGLTHELDWGNGYQTDTFLTSEEVEFDSDSSYELLNLNTRTSLAFARHEMTVGFDYRDETTNHSPDRVSIDPEMTRWQWALFGEDNFRLTDDLTLTMGLRYDENERYGSQITPRVYAVWHANPGLTIKGGVSGGYKTPTLKQADSGIFEPSGGDGTARDQGNTDLAPEESTNYEIGAIWEGAGGLQLGLTAYHTDFENKIDRDRVCDFEDLGQDCGLNDDGVPIKYIDQYMNLGAATLSGIEATLDYTIRDVDIAFNYTYADSKITEGEDEGDAFNDNPLHVVNLDLDWHASADLMLWSDLQYRSRTTDAGDSEIEEHALLDVGVDYDFNDAVTGSFAIYNVGDKTFDATGYDYGRRFFAGLTSRF